MKSKCIRPMIKNMYKNPKKLYNTDPTKGLIMLPKPLIDSISPKYCNLLFGLRKVIMLIIGIKINVRANPWSSLHDAPVIIIAKSFFIYLIMPVTHKLIVISTHPK